MEPTKLQNIMNVKQFEPSVHNLSINSDSTKIFDHKDSVVFLEARLRKDSVLT
jgi:hypothetical protein